VVEDDRSARRALCRLLRIEGFDICESDTVADAIKHLGGVSLHAVVLDLMLPDGDGAEVLRRAKTLVTPIKVIVTTGTGDSAKLAQVAALKPEVIIRKPFQFAALVELLR
jgi:DNA-binding response OmpR family regulator